MKLTELGHRRIASHMIDETLWLAWGEAPTDMSVVDENLDSIYLIDEIGRTIQEISGYVLPDAGGAISVGGQNWSLTPDSGSGAGIDPSKYFYMKFKFNPSENPDSIIRQLGLFVGVNTVGVDTYEDTSSIDWSVDYGSDITLLTNQAEYQAIFDDAGTDGAGAGELIEIMNQADLNRNTATTEGYEFIVTF